MLEQEVVIEMAEVYPFGGLKCRLPPHFQVLVRKIVFVSPEAQHRLRLQLDIIRSLPTESVVKLLRVLEEPGRLHLFYEYVPYRLQSICAAVSEQALGSLKQKVQKLANSLRRLRVNMPLTIDRIGMTEKKELKCYIGPQFEIEGEFADDGLEESYRQVSLMWRKIEVQRNLAKFQNNRDLTNKIQHTSKEAKLETTGSTYQPSDANAQQQQPMKNSVVKTEPVSPGLSARSKDSSLYKKSCANALKVLGQIQHKIQKAKNNFKKRQNEEVYQDQKCICNKPKADVASDRDQSRRTNKRQVLKGNEQFESPKSLPTPEADAFAEGSVRSPANKNSPKRMKVKYAFERVQSKNKSKFVQDDKCSQSSRLKEPRTKGDFEEIKKYEFQSLLLNKETYVCEFLDLLVDNSGDTNQKSGQKHQTSIRINSVHCNQPYPSMRDFHGGTKDKNRNDRFLASNNDEQHKQLLRRVSSGLQQCALALSRYSRK